MLDAEISTTGDVTVEGQHVGQLHGFSFVPDPGADSAEARTLRNAAQKALAGEIEARAERFASAADVSFVLSNDGTIRWTGDPVGKLEPGEKLFEPAIRILADEQLTGPAREKVENRLKAWLKAHIVRALAPVLELENAEDITGIARGIAFQISEALGVLERARVLQEVRSLEQDGRSALRQKGVRFGAYHIYMPAMLKPGPRTLATQLWALKNGGLDQKGIDEIAHLASSGRTSIPVDPEVSKGLYRAAGFRVCGGRAVRVDILERLADLIRPAISYQPGVTVGEPPPGAADGDGFIATVAMTSLVGCAGEDFASILKSLGYASQMRPGPAITAEIRLPAATVPVRAAGVSTEVVEEHAAESAAADSADAIPQEQAAAPGEAAPGEAAPGEAAPAEAVHGEAVHGEAVHGEVSLGEISPGEAASSEAALVENAESGAAADAQQVAAPAEPEPATEAAAIEESQPGTEVAASESASEPVSDVVAETTEGNSGEIAADSTTEAAPEIELVEIWRQSRQARDGGRERFRRRGEDAGKGERGKGERGGGERGGRQRTPETRHDAVAAGDAPRGDRPAQERPKRGRDFAKHFGKGPEGEGRGKGPPRDQKRGNGGGQIDRPREPRREKQADPDSPFAKLAALKAQLEGKDR